MTLDKQIAKARRHVAVGQIIIDRQRALVARHGTQASAELLERFEQTQAAFESDLACLLNRMN